MKLASGTTAAIAAAVLLALLVPAVGAADPTGVEAGYLQISSTPPGAMVFVNQAKMNGVTPVTLRVPAGQQQAVVVNLNGYEAMLQTVTVQPNETLPMQFDLKVLAAPTETAGAAGSPSGTRAIWVEETPLPAAVALLALAGAGLLAVRRRR